jgi:hypothetical protein
VHGFDINLFRRKASERHVRSVVIVSPDPLGCQILRLLNTFKDMSIKKAAAHGAIISFDIRVLLRLARLDVAQDNAPSTAHFAAQPFIAGADIFGAIVTPDLLRLSASLNDPLQTLDHPLARHTQFLRHFALQSSPGFDAQIQAQSLVNSIHPLAIPSHPQHVSHV